jgi:hypothetical protein
MNFKDGAVEKSSFPKGHYSLRRCAANRTAQRMSILVTFRLYASRLSFLRALQLIIFEQPSNRGFFKKPTCTVEKLYYLEKVFILRYGSGNFGEVLRPLILYRYSKVLLINTQNESR